jgi:hypothetical protein
MDGSWQAMAAWLILATLGGLGAGFMGVRRR